MLSPHDRLVIALNEDSDTIVAFDVDETGRPVSQRTVATCGSPVCMVFSGTVR